MSESDDLENNLIAAGAVLSLLMQHSGLLMQHSGPLRGVNVVADAEGNPTNQIDIRLSFMASPYRITVERVADTETEQPS